MSITQRLIITGRVQGVGYRNWTMGAARALGITGWVRNVNGSSVEILASGDQEAIDALVEACRSGPRLARVDNIDVAPSDDGQW